MGPNPLGPAVMVKQLTSMKFMQFTCMYSPVHTVRVENFEELNFRLFGQRSFLNNIRSINFRL